MFRYKSRDEFARDAMLVFFNCKTYNEDESEVRQWRDADIFIFIFIFLIKIKA